MTDPDKCYASTGESARTPEFKQSRQELIDQTNSFLGRMLDLRDSLTAPKGGWLLLETPRLTTTDMGRVGHNRHGMVEEFMPGISLASKGEEPGSLLFQSVTVNAETGEREVILVTGSAPDAKKEDDEVSLKRQGETVVSFEARTRESPEAPERYFGFTVRGDGSVHRQYLGMDDKTGISQPVYKADDLGAAKLALGQITNAY